MVCVRQICSAPMNSENCYHVGEEALNWQILL